MEFWATHGYPNLCTFLGLLFLLLSSSFFSSCLMLEAPNGTTALSISRFHMHSSLTRFRSHVLHADCHPKWSLNPQPSEFSCIQESPRPAPVSKTLPANDSPMVWWLKEAQRNRMEQSTTKRLLIWTIFEKCNHPIFPSLHCGL